MERYQGLDARLRDIGNAIQERQAKRTRITLFLEQLEGSGVIREYDEELWYATVDMVEVHAGKTMVFTFRDGRRETVLPEDWE